MSTPVRALPRTFRPRWGRRTVYAAAAVLVAVTVLLAVGLPGEGRLAFGLPDRLAVVGFGLLAAYLLHRLAAVRVECDPAGLTVVNYRHRRRLEWAEVLGVRLGRGQPWLVLDLADGTALPAMGIQGSDGAYAQDQARELARLVHEHGR